MRPQQPDHHALDNKLHGGDEVGIPRVLSAEKWPAALDEITFQGGFAVDEGGDNIERTRLARREENEISFENAGVFHRIAADAQREKFGIGPNTEGDGVDGNIAVGFLLGSGRAAGGNCAVERDLGESAATRVRLREKPPGLAIEPTKRAFRGEGIDMALDAERTGQAEMRLDFPERRRDTVLPVVAVDEIEDLLLALGEGIAHSVHVNTLAGKCKSADRKMCGRCRDAFDGRTKSSEAF
jgi:hypothetical protein